MATRAILVIGLVMPLMGQAKVPSRSPSSWTEIESPDPACATEGVEVIRTRDLQATTLEGKAVRLASWDLALQPVITWAIGMMSGDYVAVFAHRPGAFLAWDQSNKQWLWVQEIQAYQADPSWGWSPDKQTFKVNLALEYVSLDGKLLERIVKSERVAERSDTQAPECYVYQDAVLVLDPSQLQIRRSPAGDPVPLPSARYSRFLWPLRFKGDWAEVIPGEDRGFSGDGIHPSHTDGSDYFIHWRRDLKGWIRYREDGPIPGSKRLLIR